MRAFVFLLLCVCLASCITDVNVNLFEEKMVVTSFIAPQNDSVTVALATNVPVVGNASVKELANAQVILKDDSKEYALKLLPKSAADTKMQIRRYGIATPTSTIKAGKSYALSVVNDDGKRAESSCTIPEKEVGASNIKINFVEKSPNKIQYEVRWKDIDNEQNYYVASVYLLLFDDRGNTAQYNTGLYYKKEDEKANGEMTIGTLTYDNITFKYNPAKSYIVASVGNTDKNYYDYNAKIFAQSRQNNANMFPEPVLIQQNIVGGLGVFGGYNATTKFKFLSEN